MVLHRCDNLDGLYPVNSTATSTSAPVALSATVDLWHARLGHPNPATLHHILRTFSFTCNKTDDHTCHACRLDKHVRLLFSASSSVASYPFELIHSDLWTSPVARNTDFFYTILSYLMIFRTMCGPSRCGENLMHSPFSLLFTPMLLRSLGVPFMPCRLTTGRSSTTSGFAPSLPHTA